MTQAQTFEYFSGNSFSDLFAQDLTDQRYAFLLSYPSTAGWDPYPNTREYLIQDGSTEGTKVGYDKIRKLEPWKNLAVLGDAIPGLLTERPPPPLLSYWQEHFGFGYDNAVLLSPETCCDDINRSEHYDKILTLFPYDHILPEKHAVDPASHYELLSKTSLADMGVHYPLYKVFDFREVRPEDVELHAEYPYLIKTSHGLSGEGTYIIHNENDLDHCRREVRTYLQHELLDAVVVSDFVQNVVGNYCVQFYVDKQAKPTLVGATHQLVTPAGVHLGGLINYDDREMDKFHHKIAVISRFVHKHGYFGMLGIDILEDAEGQLHVIDANIRVNGSTPLCLQRNVLRGLGKEVAKYSSDYRMEGTLDANLVQLRQYLDRKDFIVLSALEKTVDARPVCELYGIVTGETLEEMRAIESELAVQGLKIAA